jgi:hypothetical protein
VVADFDQLFDQAATVAPEKVLDKLTSLQSLNPSGAYARAILLIVYND